MLDVDGQDVHLGAFNQVFRASVAAYERYSYSCMYSVTKHNQSSCLYDSGGNHSTLAMWLIKPSWRSLFSLERSSTFMTSVYIMKHPVMIQSSTAGYSSIEVFGLQPSGVLMFIIVRVDLLRGVREECSPMNVAFCPPSANECRAKLCSDQNWTDRSAGRTGSRPSPHKSTQERDHHRWAPTQQPSQNFCKNTSLLLSPVFSPSLPGGRFKCHEWDCWDGPSRGHTHCLKRHRDDSGWTNSWAQDRKYLQSVEILVSKYLDWRSHGAVTGEEKQIFTEHFPNSTSNSGWVDLFPVVSFRFPVIQMFNTIFAGIYCFTLGQIF